MTEPDVPVWFPSGYAFKQYIAYHWPMEGQQFYENDEVCVALITRDGDYVLCAYHDATQIAVWY